MTLPLRELKRGLAEARPYLLSHHVPSERHRCYSPTLFGKRVDFCARCLGIYPGIAAGLAAATLQTVPGGGLTTVAALPAPALLDWTLTTFTERQGSNRVRTATGLLLGYAYGLGLRHLLDGSWGVILVGAVYAILAGVLLWRSEAEAQ